MSETIAAISTPPGAGGIAVLRISGPMALQVAQRCFQPWVVNEPAPRRATYGAWFESGPAESTTHASQSREREPTRLDDVVCTYFAAPHSYTGEEVVEVSCHGSPYVQHVMLQSCLDAGCRVAEPGEYTQRAFLNGRLDLAQAEGVGDLIAAETEASHRLALEQVQGKLSDELHELRARLLNFAALVELENDFGEEDVDFADRTQLLIRVRDARSRIQYLLSTFRAGQAMRDGVRVVIAGRPNAGKSTLLNALLQTDRAIVSEHAGTTRDTIEEQLVLRGVKFRLIDTAGIRAAADDIEAQGIQRARTAVASAQVLVYVWDVLRTKPEEVASDLAELGSEGRELIAVANKMDLNPYTKVSDYDPRLVPPDRFVPMVASQDMNLELLKERLFDVGVGEVPTPGSPVLSHLRHVGALREADSALARVEEGIATNLSGDLTAIDLRHALYHVGSVTGEVSVDDLLGEIFSSFCIGK